MVDTSLIQKITEAINPSYFSKLMNLIYNVIENEKITEALKPSYLSKFMNPISNVIEHPIDIIFKTLSCNYRNINTNELLNKCVKFYPTILISIPK